MKVLVVNTSDTEGGAARAAYRLHQSLLRAGITSTLLVQTKCSDDFTVIGPEDKLQKGLAKVRSTLDAIPVSRYKERTRTLFSPGWLPFSNVVDRINKLKPDIVHLHWVAGGMLRIEDIARIEAPIVWSLHDNWAFTGGCHIMWECQRYKQSCGACPRLSSSKEKDLSRRVWLRKQKTFSRLPEMRIVGLSNWLANCARQSALLGNNEVLCLPNPIDTETYSPFDRGQARKLLNLPQNKKLILFGAMNATAGVNKGYHKLAEALDHLPPEYELVVFGSTAPRDQQGFKQKAYYLGRLHDDVSLRVLYSSADVMLVPSLQENLSNAIMESLACGTPVVAFDIGGNGDLIEHEVNGYLAEPYDTCDLARGINWVLQHKTADSLAYNARQKVVDNFEGALVSKKYIDLYNEVLSREK